MKKVRPPDMPRTYAELCAMLLPRPIRSATAFYRAFKMIKRLAGYDLYRDQRDYQDALSTFVERYEEEKYPMDGISNEVIEARMEEARRYLYGNDYQKQI